MQPLTLALAFSIILAFAQSATATPITVWNGGFETWEATSGVVANGLPSSIGDWSGDESEIVGSQNGISPSEGSHMLHLISTTNPIASWGISSDIWQLVDVTQISEAIDTGQVTANWSAYFNRIAGDSETEPQFVINIRAYAGAPNTFPIDAESYTAKSGALLMSDADPQTWEQISTGLLLPIGTTYIGVLVAARETINDSKYFEFVGHYADQTALTFSNPVQFGSLDDTSVPEPGTVGLLGSGLAALGLRLLGLKRRFSAPGKRRPGGQ